ncbi:MAG: hypothetical protein IPL75_13580 [Acidobacteria bacterium]|nr:hypothetical protein [Acidobacteriota bacterium]
MITGSVDRHWASHHYGRWYRENFTDPAAAAGTRVETAPHAGAATGAARHDGAAVAPPAKGHAPSDGRVEPSASTG